MDPVSIIRTTVAVIAGIGINMLISKKLSKRDKQFKGIRARVKDGGIWIVAETESCEVLMGQIEPSDAKDLANWLLKSVGLLQASEPHE